MRGQAAGTALRAVGRQIFLGGLAVATALLGIALLAAALTTGGTVVELPLVRSGAGQGDGGPSIVAVGSGRATAPAETATIQMLVGRDFSGGIEADDDPLAAQEAAVAPLVQAIVGTGVSEDAVAIVTSPGFTSYYGPPGSFAVRLDVSLRAPTAEAVAGVVSAAAGAAVEERMAVQEVGVGYAVADCGPLRLAARERATAQATLQARQQAEVLGVRLGALRQVEDVPLPGGAQLDEAGGCGSAVGATTESGFFGYRSGIIDVPLYDPTAPAEAAALAQVSLTYDVAQGA